MGVVALAFFDACERGHGTPGICYGEKPIAFSYMFLLASVDAPGMTSRASDPS